MPKILHLKIYQRIYAGVVHFWKDTTGDFAFEHFHSLPIHDGEHDEDDSDSDSDSDSDDDDSDDDDKGKKAVLSWTVNAGSPTMASGYLGVLKEWSFGKSQQEDIPGSLEGDNKATTVSGYATAPIFA